KKPNAAGFKFRPDVFVALEGPEPEGGHVRKNCRQIFLSDVERGGNVDDGVRAGRRRMEKDIPQPSISRAQFCHVPGSISRRVLASGAVELMDRVTKVL